MKKAHALILATTLVLLRCSAIPERPGSLTSRAPSVTSIVPPVGATVSMRPQWTVVFSHSMDEESMTPEAVVLVPKSDREKVPMKTTKALLDAIDDGDFSSLPLDWRWDEAGRTLSLTVEGDLELGKSYELILTPRLKSLEKIPLKPLPDLPEPASFILSYRVSGDENFTIGNYEASVTPEDESVSEEGSEPELPKETEEPEVPGVVVVNEIFYDAVGADTDGVVFVELYGPPGKKIEGYTVAFVDGSDGSVDDTIVLPSSARIPEDGFFVIADARTGTAAVSQVASPDLIDNFDPQNGPDAIQLFNAQGHMIDVVGYGAGLTAASEAGFALFESVPAADVVNGKSLERVEPGKDTDNNQSDFVERAAPTPGS